MPARIASLDDLDGGFDTKKTDFTNAKLQLCHIPTLANAKQCRSLLERIYKEFYPILEKRGYNVSSLSEMCCCGDGLDHDKQSKRRRKLKIMSAQVGGYNMTRGGGRGGKSHSIHLRLRNPHNHSVVLSYEEVAGVMAHELAHCEHGPHNAAFYKLMDDILDQHAVFMSKGIVADPQGFPMNSSQAYTLGGGRNRTSGTAQTAALQAAQRRQAQQQWRMPSGPQKLGGSSLVQGLLPPGQAAAQAAHERRLRDEVWCQPCAADDVIELSSDSEDEKQDCKKPAAKQQDDATKKKKKIANQLQSVAVLVVQMVVVTRRMPLLNRKWPRKRIVVNTSLKSQLLQIQLLLLLLLDLRLS